jgi:hypothetical protein
MARQFRAPISMTFKIVDGGTIVGTVRIKPSTLSWKPKGKHLWRGLTQVKKYLVMNSNKDALKSAKGFKL